MSEPAHFEAPRDTASPAVKPGAVLLDEIPLPARSRLVEGWKKLGAGALVLSLGLHLLVFLVAGVLVFSAGSSTQRGVDFLSGGGGEGDQVSQEIAHRAQEKRRKVLIKSVPLKRTVSLSDADLSLPDAPPDLMDLSKFDARKAAARARAAVATVSARERVLAARTAVPSSRS